jgi:aryl-alcohol dehydrogenase-like predicted oxidoreductase
MALPTRRIGDATVSAIGLGSMPLSFPDMLDHRERALQTIHRALDLGITLLDTANIYAPTWETVGHNEQLVAEALRCYTGPAPLDEVLVATKGGLTRGPGETWGRDASRSGLTAACEASLRALDTDVIDLYQLHRHDPVYSYADQMRVLAELQQLGLVRRIGLSNCTLPELEVALEIAGGPADGGIVSVQNEWSPRYRGERDVLERCSELGIAFLPWSPLGGSTQAREVGSHYAEFAVVGDEQGVNAQEAVLAWLLATTTVMIPIPGATRTATVDSIVHSVQVDLSADQVARLDATAPEMESMYPDDLPRSPLL